MAYYLHIERNEESPIAFGEWQAAVEKTANARLSTASERSGINPHSGEVLRMRANEGDVEVCLPESREWVPAFRWCEDSAVFAPRADVIHVTHPIWKAAVSLATILNARIRGDSDEQYDLATGEVTDA
jgi:hypothetical protein